ncbi:MAG TPA: hypothetical protein VGN97_01375 [Mesorhizobium sp.]|jgi:uncharacterized protein YraI|nr:hypothetical protein [Mesorhizobium sp.]
MITYWLYSSRRAVLAAAVGGLAVWLPVPAHAQIDASYVKVDRIAQGRVLWVRSGPGRNFKRIGFLPHNARHIRSYGCKEIGTGYWCEIRYRGTRGWASGRFLANDRARRA